MMSRARENDLQSKLSEVLNRLEQTEQEKKTIESESMTLQQQHFDLTAMLQKAQ